MFQISNRQSAMKRSSVSLLENILVSVGGHLVIVALMITSFVILGDRMVKIVAPDRIQIIEIDLSKVQITKDETFVYNTDAAKPDKQEAPESKPAAAEEEKLEDWQAEKKDEKKPAAAEAKPEPKKTPKSDKAPESKTTVRVNRETAPLNRTMTVSVIDALRVAMTRCWQFDGNRPGVADIRAVAHLTMSQNGMVRDLWFEESARANGDPAFSYILDTIRAAVGACQPFRMLPAGEYESWKNIQLTFYPSNASVQ